MKEGTMKTFIIVSILLGAFFLIGSFIILVVMHDLSPEAIWVIRVIVSLGAGFLSAGILGNVSIEGTVANITIKAGGPIAITVILYLLNPPRIFL